MGDTIFLTGQLELLSRNTGKHESNSLGYHATQHENTPQIDVQCSQEETDSCHREAGKSSREHFEKGCVNTVFF